MHRHVRAALVCACLLALACSDDGTRPADTKPPVPDPYQDLTQKDHVLQNIELAMNERDVNHYIGALEPNEFVFFFSAGDVGGNVPESWGFVSEKRSIETMFLKGGGITDNPIVEIEFDLDIENAAWVEFNSVDYPGVYEAILTVKFEVTTEGAVRYISQGNSRSQFRIREDGGKWHLVEWRDLGTSRLYASAGPAGTEQISLSKLKGLYNQ